MAETSSNESGASAGSRKEKVTSIPKWEANARERIASGLKKVAKPIEALKERDAGEADTRLLITDILCDLLGFDKYEDLTAEYQVKGEFADYGIRIDQQLVAFLEIKRITQRLSQTHLRQVETYALKNGVTWAILTNAQVWQIYNVQALSGEVAETSLVFEVDLLDPTVKPKDKVEQMFYISKEAISKGLLDQRWKSRFASSPKALKSALLSEGVLNEVRKELWRQFRTRVEDEELRSSINALF